MEQGFSLARDIETALVAFLQNLNWTFIFNFSFVIYGIRNEEDFLWYNELAERKGFAKTKIWLAGILIMLMTCMFCYLEYPNEFTAGYVSSLLRSFLVAIVLNKVIATLIDSSIKKQIRMSRKPPNKD